MAIKMYKINIGQKTSIENKPLEKGWFYNPVQDVNGDWFISEIEMNTIIINQGWKNALEATYIPPTPTEII